MSTIKLIISAVVLFSLTRTLMRNWSFDFIKDIVRLFSLRMFIHVVLCLVATLITAVVLINSFPIMKHGWSSLFFGKSINIATAPMSIIESSFITIAFVLFLIVLIPFLAYQEELLFRHNKNKLSQILISSFLFGIAHCIVGVPIGIGLALVISGLLYSYAYHNSRGNSPLMYSTAYHTMYNWTICLMLLLSEFNKLLF